MVTEVLRLCVIAAALIGLVAWSNWPQTPVRAKADTAVGPCHYVPDTDFAACVLDKLLGLSQDEEERGGVVNRSAPDERSSAIRRLQAIIPRALGRAY
jgi:hypothetical protein